ncbi:MAG: flagellar biosynthesis protein FliQ [Alphaproteobacteria bacterium]
MNGTDVLDIARDALWVTLVLAGPILVTALVVGLVISLIQALTQIQEMTLTFVPKILSIFFALLLLFPFMGKVFQGFSERLFDRIVTISAHE